MDNEKLTTPENSRSRRKFVWGAGILTALAVIGKVTGLPLFSKKNTPIRNRTVKMLTQDGKLVEIDESLITASRKKVTNTELQNWIRK
ncbi:MAG: hypothetical protein JST32_21455 [Bacteroidetes bacterium]|nr:hypothetical protein [Bacteroidota bacterium]